MLGRFCENMRDWWGFYLFLFVLALSFIPALSKAVDDPIHPFPRVLVDAACTDDFSAPTVGTIANPQLTGSADGLCDGGTSVLTGAFTVDTNTAAFGSSDYQSGYLHVDATAVTGGATTWRLCLTILTPWDAATFTKKASCTGTLTGNKTDTYIGVGPLMFATSTFDEDVIPQPLPKTFKFTIDLIGATSWTGSLGFIPVGRGGR